MTGPINDDSKLAAEEFVLDGCSGPCDEPAHNDARAILAGLESGTHAIYETAKVGELVVAARRAVSLGADGEWYYVGDPADLAAIIARWELNLQ